MPQSADQCHPVQHKAWPNASQDFALHLCWYCKEVPGRLPRVTVHQGTHALVCHTISIDNIVFIQLILCGVRKTGSSMIIQKSKGTKNGKRKREDCLTNEKLSFALSNYLRHATPRFYASQKNVSRSSKQNTKRRPEGEQLFRCTDICCIEYAIEAV